MAVMFLAERCKLALLNLADLAFGVEHIHMNAVYAKEAVGHGRACVAACCHKHVDLLLAFLTDKILKEASHEACAYILEGKGGTVEQLQTVDVGLHLHDGTVEGQRVIHNLFQRFRLYIFAEESLCHVVSNLLERELVDVVKKLLWQTVNALRHVKATVGCQSAHHCFVQRCQRGFMVGAVIFHN